MGMVKSLKSEKFEKSLYFSKEVFVLKICGVSLLGKRGMAYKIYAFLSIFATHFMYALLEYAEMFKYDFAERSGIIIYANSGIMSLAKAIAMTKNREKLAVILEKLEKKPFAPNMKRGGDVEMKLIKECVWLTSVQNFTYWVLSVFVISCSILYTLYKRITSSDYHDWQFGFGPFTPLNVTYSPNFELCWFYQNISIVHIAGVFSSTDLLLAALLAHVSYQFKILQNCLRNVVEVSHQKMIQDDSTLQSLKDNMQKYKTDGSIISWKYLRACIKDAVLYHSEIIDMASELEEIFNKVLLLTFLGTLTQLCFSLHQASALNNGAWQVKHLIEGSVATMQVITVCYWGEQVLQESQQVGFAAYESNFVGTDLRFQKDLVYIIRRSQNPTKLTTGRFADICLTTFAWIMRMSYSAFMILQRNNNA